MKIPEVSVCSTTSRDAAAISYLLERGDNLSVVANFMDQPFVEQRQILQNLLNSARHIKVHNLDVVAVTETRILFLA